MLFRRLLRVILPIIVLTIGFWLLLRPATISPENLTHHYAMQSVAPVQPNRPGNPWSGNQQTADPVSVHLGQISPGVYDPNNQLDRWLRGEIDLEENNGMAGEAVLAALRQNALQLESNPAIQQNGSQPLTAVIHQQFDSLDYNDCCGGGGNVPPDAQLAAGPDHVVTAVNVALAIYDKTGNLLLGPTTLASFMAANPQCTILFDPNTLYDEEANRFLVGADAGGSHYCLAVSQTADPTAGWNIYAFAAGTGLFDYPQAGVGAEAIYMGGNIFANGHFAESRVWAFDKWAMYYGLPAIAITHTLGDMVFTPQPLHLHGWQQGTWPAEQPHYILAETGGDGAGVVVYAWDDPFGSNALMTVGVANLNDFTGVTAGLPIYAPQLGGADLKVEDWRPQDFEYRNGYAWTTMTVACNPESGTVDCIRWAQIDPATAQVVQAGVYSSSEEEYRFYPNLAVNHCNDMLVGYTKSSVTMFPSVWFTGREHGDDANGLQAEGEMKAGELSYVAFDAPPYRWGDYSSMTIDPDGTTFWYAGQYSKDTGSPNGRWGTYISAVSFPACQVIPPTPTPSPSPTPTGTPFPTPPTTVGDAIYISASQSGQVEDVSFADEDILGYDMGNNTWHMVFDGSDVGLIRGDVDAVTLLADNRLLLSFDRPIIVPGLGLVDDSDIVAFLPVVWGVETSGTFEWYLDGSDVGLTAVFEDIDTIAFDENGRLLISTTGSVSVAGAAGMDEDLLAFTPASLGNHTSGSWSLYFDGSDVGLTDAGEDIWGAWLNTQTQKLYLITQANFAVTNLTGNAGDIFPCELLSTGENTDCLFNTAVFWDSHLHNFSTHTIDAFTLAR